MPLKITIFYNQVNRGWTETFYKTGEAPPLLMPNNDLAVFEAAIAFRSPLTTMEWVRYSVVGSPQKVNSFRMSNRVAAEPDQVNTPDIVQTDALYRLLTSTFARRTISLRGLFDNSVKRNAITGAFEPTPFLVGGVTAYLDLVKSNAWLIRKVQTVSNTPGLQQVAVQAMSADLTNPGRTVVALSAPLAGLAVGEKIRFYGKIDPRVLPVFPRTPTVRALVAVPSPGVTIDYTLPGNAPISITDVNASKLLYTYEPPVQYSFQSLSKRDTGRPFGSSRGRQTSLGSRR